LLYCYTNFNLYCTTLSFIVILLTLLCITLSLPFCTPHYVFSTAHYTTLHCTLLYTHCTTLSHTTHSTTLSHRYHTQHNTQSTTHRTYVPSSACCPRKQLICDWFTALPLAPVSTIIEKLLRRKGIARPLGMQAWGACVCVVCVKG
jgi:hypothetical protein